MWGSSFVASKVCINSGMQPFETIFIRFSFGALLIWIIFHKRFRPYNCSAIRLGLLLGISTASGFALEMTGLVTVEASKASFLTATNIVILPVMYCIRYQILPRRSSFIAILSAFFGVTALSFTGDIFSPIEVGDILLLGAACTYAINSMLAVTLHAGDSMIQVSFIQFTTTAGIMGILTWIHGCGGIYTMCSMSATAYLIICPTVICYIIKNSAIQYLTPVRCSLILATQGIFCAALSILILGDTISWRILIGSVLIGIAIILETLYPMSNRTEVVGGSIK